MISGRFLKDIEKVVSEKKNLRKGFVKEPQKELQNIHSKIPEGLKDIPGATGVFRKALVYHRGISGYLSIFLRGVNEIPGGLRGVLRSLRGVSRGPSSSRGYHEVSGAFQGV